MNFTDHFFSLDQQSNNGDNTKRLRSASDGDKRIPTGVPLNGKENHIPAADDGHHSQKVVDLNDDISLRVVTFQVSMSSLMLFSAGNKQLLLEKKIREISYCTKVPTVASHNFCFMKIVVHCITTVQLGAPTDYCHCFKYMITF